MKIGLLLINLGTPRAPTRAAVHDYLEEFLMDPYVITLPTPLRWLLVKIILRTRPQASAKLYQKIWTPQGSPLLVYSTTLKENLAQQLTSENYIVELGMRYGDPSIASALEKLMQHSIQKLIVLPLFPQHAQATTESAIHHIKKAMSAYKQTPDVTIIHDFYNHPSFIDAYATIIEEHLKKENHEMLLMSYHGLPATARNQQYRTQCYSTSQLITEKLHLSSEKYYTSFQSRLGKAPWIKPYTEQVLPELRQQGITKLAVACPSFVVDCLETLEEINIRARAQWMSLGGTVFTMVPCLNADGHWIETLITMGIGE